MRKATFSAVLVTLVIAFALADTTARAAAPDPGERPLKGTVTGRVLAPDGQLVPGAFVSAIHVLRPEDPDAAYPPVTTHADENGRFSYDALDSGLYAFFANSPDYARGIVKGVMVPAGGRLDGLEIAMKPGETVTGRVVTPDGQPVAGAYVEALYLQQSTTTDAEGRFRLGGIPRDAVTVFLQAGKQGYAQHSESVAPGARDLAWVLVPQPDGTVRTPPAPHE